MPGLPQSFAVRYDENNQEFSLSGTVRPETSSEIADCMAMFDRALRHVRGTLYVNVKRLARLNNTGFRILARGMVEACRARPELRIVVVTSSVVGWATAKFGRLRQIEPRISVNEYDGHFYPGQSFLEDGGFIRS